MDQFTYVDYTTRNVQLKLSTMIFITLGVDFLFNQHFNEIIKDNFYSKKRHFIRHTMSPLYSHIFILIDCIDIKFNTFNLVANFVQRKDISIDFRFLYNLNAPLLDFSTCF